MKGILVIKGKEERCLEFYELHILDRNSHFIYLSVHTVSKYALQRNL